MKILLLILIFSYSLFAADSSKKEADVYLQAVKEVEVEKQVLEQAESGECKAKAESITDVDEKKLKIKECFQEKLNSLDDETIKVLAEQADLKSYDPEKTKNAKSIRDYFSERLEKAIHGRDYDPNDKNKNKKKLVGQDVYMDMYKAQLGKNILLEVSQYCLEGIQVKGTEYPTNALFEFDGMSKTIFTPIQINCPSTSKPWTNCEDKGIALNTESGFKSFSSDRTWWNKFEEVEDYYSGTVSSSIPAPTADEKKKLNKRTEQIQKFSKEEFSRGPEYLKHKYMMCTQVIKNMCERYEYDHLEDNTLEKLTTDLIQLKEVVSNLVTERDNPNTTPARMTLIPTEIASKENDIKNLELDIANKKEFLAKNPVSDVKVGLKEDSNHGRKACILMSRLRDYRKTLSALATAKGEMDKLKENGASFSTEQAFAGHYGDKQKSEKSIDEITSISSSELGEAIDNEEELKNLQEACEQDKTSEDCKKFIKDFEEDDFNKVEVEFESATALKLKELQQLETKEDEEIRAYLESNGMLDELKIYNDDPGKLKELVAIVQNKYKSERLAVIKELKSKFETKSIKDTDKADKHENVYARVKEEIEDKKDRLENLFHYSNIITSYLEIEGEKKGDDTSRNVVGIKNEIDARKEAGVDEEYFTELEQDLEDTNAAGDAVFVNIGVIDSILGNTQEAKDAIQDN